VASDSIYNLLFDPLPPPDPPSVTGDDLEPVVFGLAGIYPTPFNGVTTIRYGADRAEPIRIAVYDIVGRQVAVLTNRTESIGWHRVSWSAGNVPSGLYIIRLEAGSRVQTAKATLIK